MAVRPEEIASIIRQQIEGFDTGAVAADTGTVVEAGDPEDDALSFEWILRRESEATQSGGDVEVVPDRVAFTSVRRGAGKIELRAPAEPGAYRLFVYVGDGRGAVAHANVPFLVVGR